MAKRKAVEPVTESEVEAVVLRAIATSFGNRPLDFSVARRGLAGAAHHLISLELREAGTFAADLERDAADLAAKP